MRKYCLSFLLLSFLFTSEISASPMFYTFEGTITTVLDRSGGIEITGFNADDPVTFTFLVDFDAPGQWTSYLGVTHDMIDVGYTRDFFYADLLEDVSSPTLPKYDGIEINPSVAQMKNNGENFQNADSQHGWLYSNSSYNEFMIHKESTVTSWTLGESVYGMSKSQIFAGNNTWLDLVNYDLDLTSIEPATVVPEPASLFLLGSGLLAMVFKRK